jgi:hypothetical protein
VSDAVGVHDHPQQKLGLRPGDPERPALRLRDFVRQVPDHPIGVDDLNGVVFALDHNDSYGTCVPTGADNLRRLVTQVLTGSRVDATWDEVCAWYRSQNPGFDPTLPEGDPRQEDGGMVIQEFLEYLTREGVILGFAKVDPTDEEEVKAALYLFLGVLNGLDLHVAQQAQTRAGQWDYVAGSPGWGGHCTLSGAYSPSDRSAEANITWAQRVEMTTAFLRHQRSEVWVAIFRAHAEHPEFRAGFDLAKYAQAFTDITGRPFPEVTPAPGPTPGDGASFLDEDPRVATRVDHEAAAGGQTRVERVMEILLHHYHLR